jgi:hypothetical protein
MRIGAGAFTSVVRFAKAIVGLTSASYIAKGEFVARVDQPYATGLSFSRY